MKFRWILVVLGISLLLFIGGCGGTVCGDDKCDVTESCQCDDCKEDAKCTVKTVGNCDDSNDCTDDVFNERTNQCEHTKTSVCCGNGVCEDGERCSEESHQTLCAKDCTYLCPSFVKLGSFECGTARCEKTGENKFTISGSTSIQVSLENIGEKGTDAISHGFKCGRGTTNIISRNGDSIYGITFRDFFNNGDSDLYLSGRQSESGGNKGIYKLSFEYSKAEYPDLECQVSLQNMPQLNYIDRVYLNFK